MRKGNNYETTIMGNEPVWDGCDSWTEEQLSSKLGKALNWYNYFCNDDEYRDFVIEYFKENKSLKDLVIKVKSLDKNNYMFRSLGGMCRCLTLKGKLVGKDKEIFDKNFNKFLEVVNSTTEKEEQKTVRPSVQENIQQKISNTICNLDAKLDEFITTPDYKQFLKTFNIETWIHSNNLKPYECGAISQHFSKIKQEYDIVLEGKDKDLVMAYEYISKPKQKKLVELLSEIINITGQYALQKKNRKPRKKKKKKPEQLIKKLKYQKEDTELGLTSIDPRDIIGASKVVVFNTKYCKICVFECDVLDGISIKGTTLQNISKSYSKTVRKPKEFFKQLGGIRSVQNQYESLKTKETEPSPRINEHTIIVKAFK